MGNQRSGRASNGATGRFQISLRNLMILIFWASVCGAAVTDIGRLSKGASIENWWTTIELWLAAVLAVWSPVLAAGALINRSRLAMLMGIAVAGITFPLVCCLMLSTGK